MIDSLETAKKLGHRRIVVAESIEDAKRFLSIVEEKRPLGKGAILYEDPSVAEEFEGEKISYEESQKLLGRTYDYIVLDMTKSVFPEICRGIETVSGGGFVLAITPRGIRRDPSEDALHKRLIVPPRERAGDAFLRRFSSILERHEGVILFSRNIVRPYPKRAPKRKRIRIPKERRFPESVYKLAKSQDQVEAIKAIERLLKAENRSVVITADRGRGKSAAVGIALAALMKELSKKRGRRVVALLTAPYLENVQVLLQFFGKAMKILGEKVKFYKHHGLLEGAAGKYYYIRYMPPSVALSKAKEYYHVIVVDEASAVPIHVIESLLRRSKRFIFSSTISGYEGLGRTFANRLLKRLEEKTKLKRVELEEPIRYSAGDPVEAFIYKAFLLDVELPKLSKEDYELISRASYKHRFLDKSSIESLPEEKLREIRSIMVYAHYRNNPKDLILLLDAPHHHLYYTELENGKVIGVSQIALEGELPEELIASIVAGEKDTPGHLIPNLLGRMYAYREVLRLRGARIVRIAVHPSAQRRGIGSSLLKFISEDHERLGIKRLGSAFGATEELLRFRRRQGFYAVYISPRRNPVSGEYTIAVLKPIEIDASLVTEEFLEYFLRTLPRTYRDMHPGIVAEILEMRPRKEESRLDLTPSQKHRLSLYIKGNLPRGSAKDATIKVARRYARSYGVEGLDEDERLVMIGLLLQNRSLEDLRRVREVDFFGKLRSFLSKKLKRSGEEIFKERDGLREARG